ncbi:thioredoxin-dependent thiol peroxidase [Paenibacillus sp. IB182496]|uniref:thioredoxin-dependent peroxiredoxin n=1 Tax=Paenibacillus sabuli TaxID=2772509 RepID=A0A927GQK7_9BACL|nr:thioredoxin-dependent thiol peroxidase [Paenibacillus sabuli]MBD2844381.1 thioredoxin-dependent thiol peroxidase [Paenibacillus sabuli]
MAELTVGRVVPDFKLPASSGEEVAIRDFRGRNVVLYFYPKDNTPTCTQQSCAFRDTTDDFAASDTVIVGISTDDIASHQKFIAKHNLPFVLLADTEHKVCGKYGVWQLKKNYGREYMGIVRSTFLIDKKGKLVQEWRGVRLKGHIEAVLEAASELK